MVRTRNFLGPATSMTTVKVLPPPESTFSTFGTRKYLFSKWKRHRPKAPIFWVSMEQFLFQRVSPTTTLPISLPLTVKIPRDLQIGCATRLLREKAVGIVLGKMGAPP